MYEHKQNWAEEPCPSVCRGLGLACHNLEPHNPHRVSLLSQSVAMVQKCFWTVRTVGWVQPVYSVATACIYLAGSLWLAQKEISSVTKTVEINELG